MKAFDIDDGRLRDFLASVAAPECIDWCAMRVGVGREVVAGKIRDYVGEVPVALSLLDGIALKDRRILDVGAGIGLATFFIRRIGYDVVALEPGGTGFEVNHELFLALRDYLDCKDVTLLSIGAEALDPERHGEFDVMFSANVLEHVADLSAVVAAMAGALSPGGVMVHTCANYIIPYEPHYRLPLLPFAPAATPWAGTRRNEELWHSLNFITAHDLERLMRGAGLMPAFAAGVMAHAFERLLVDPVFASRHSPAMARVAKVLQAIGGLALLRKWPPRWATPMVVSAIKAGGGKA